MESPTACSLMVNHECSQQSSDCNSARSNIPYEDDEDSVCTVLSLQGGKRVTSPKIKITTQNHNAKPRSGIMYFAMTIFLCLSRST